MKLKGIIFSSICLVIGLSSCGKKNDSNSGPATNTQITSKDVEGVWINYNENQVKLPALVMLEKITNSQLTQCIIDPTEPVSKPPVIHGPFPYSLQDSRITSPSGSFSQETYNVDEKNIADINFGTLDKASVQQLAIYMKQCSF
jgi:hypothetical protein